MDLEFDFTADAYNGDDLFAPRIVESPDRSGLKRKMSIPQTVSRPAQASEHMSLDRPRPAQLRRYTEGDQGALRNIMRANHTPQQSTFPSAEAPLSAHTPNYQLISTSSGIHEHDFHDFGGHNSKSMVAVPEWPGDGGYTFHGKLPVQAGQSTSPGNLSASTAQGDDRDPFLNLLEQLAENERQLNPDGDGELDFLGTFGGAA